AGYANEADAVLFAGDGGEGFEAPSAAAVRVVKADAGEALQRRDLRQRLAERLVDAVHVVGRSEGRDARRDVDAIEGLEASQFGQWRVHRVQQHGAGRISHRVLTVGDVVEHPRLVSAHVAAPVFVGSVEVDVDLPVAFFLQTRVADHAAIS